MAKREDTPQDGPATETTWVFPHPGLASRGENLPGVGVGGAAVAASLADEWIAAGLATTTAPDDATPEEE